MLARMPPSSLPDRGPVTSPARDRADTCPGVLRLHRAEDGRVARIRTPGGVLTTYQAEGLADAAERLGDGHLGITSRGNVELRGLGEADGPRLAELLTEAGLLLSSRHERVRNIIATPLSGLDALGHADAQAWAAELDALLCAEDWAAELSGRFLFVLDDGRGDVAGLGGDVTLCAAPGGRSVLRVGEAPAYVVPAADAPRAALAAAEAFCAAARDSGTGAWRVRELPPEHQPDVAEALRQAGVRVLDSGAAAGPGPQAGGALPGPPPGPPPGLLAGHRGTLIVSVSPLLGRVSVAQWRALLPAFGGTLRITPWRGIVVPGLRPDDAELRLRLLADAGLLTRADDPGLGVGACTGRPGCAKSRCDVRSDAIAALTATAGPPAEASQLLPVYWSGCARRCGHPHGEWVDVSAVDDELHGAAYRVTVHRTADGGAPVAVAVPPDGLTLAVRTARLRPPTSTAPPARPPRTSPEQASPQ